MSSQIDGLPGRWCASVRFTLGSGGEELDMAGAVPRERLAWPTVRRACVSFPTNPERHGLPPSLSKAPLYQGHRTHRGLGRYARLTGAERLQGQGP